MHVTWYAMGHSRHRKRRDSDLQMKIPFDLFFLLFLSTLNFLIASLFSVFVLKKVV